MKILIILKMNTSLAATSSKSSIAAARRARKLDFLETAAADDTIKIPKKIQKFAIISNFTINFE